MDEKGLGASREKTRSGAHPIARALLSRLNRYSRKQSRSLVIYCARPKSLSRRPSFFKEQTLRQHFASNGDSMGNLGEGPVRPPTYFW